MTNLGEKETHLVIEALVYLKPSLVRQLEACRGCPDVAEMITEDLVILDDLLEKLEGK